jgi:hypothetical protein
MITITEFCREQAEPPGFLEAVWPHFEADSELVANTYVLRYPSGAAYVYDRIAETCAGLIRKQQSDGVLELGPLRDLQKDALETVRYGSFYNGHLNLLFAVATSDVKKLSVLSCFNEQHQLTWEGFEALGANDRTFLAAALQRMPTSYSALAFAHDGEPLYVFGRKEVSTS